MADNNENSTPDGDPKNGDPRPESSGTDFSIFLPKEGEDYTGQPGPENDWDVGFARRLLGKYVMASMNYLEADGTTVRRLEQYHGVVIDANQVDGFTLALRGKYAGKTIVLPPNPSSFVKLAPGKYRLSATDEKVVNPDYTSLWKIVELDHKSE